MEEIKAKRTSITISIILGLIVTFSLLYFMSSALPQVDFNYQLIHNRVPDFSTIPIT